MGLNPPKTLCYFAVKVQLLLSAQNFEDAPYQGRALPSEL